MLVEDGDAVFFVGNSFFNWDECSLPDWVTQLGLALTPPFHLETASCIVWGNTPLSDFLEHEAVQDALSTRKYKVFVLQAEEEEPVDNKAGFHQVNQ